MIILLRTGKVVEGGGDAAKFAVIRKELLV
jgi:hypothetical protein